MKCALSVFFCFNFVQTVKIEEMEESVGENTPQKLSSASSSSEIVTASDTAITKSV